MQAAERRMLLKKAKRAREIDSNVAASHRGAGSWQLVQERALA